MRNLLLIVSLAATLLPGCVKDLPPMTGGVSDATKTAEGRKAAEFAVKQQAARSGEALKLAGVVHAQQQVMGGMNYTMTLQVRSGQEMRMAQAVVYESPAPQMMLTSWDWIAE